MKCLFANLTTSLLLICLIETTLLKGRDGFFAIRNSAMKNNRRMGYGIRIEELLNPETYHKYIRPGMSFDHPLYINISIAVSSIDEIADVHMEYTITFTLYQSWRDERLDKLRLGINFKPVTMDASVGKRMWVPDTYIVNAHTSFIHDVTTRNGLLILYPNGTVIYVLRITSRVACPMKLFKYPMDEQVCRLKLASWSFTDENVFYKWSGKEVCRGAGGSVTGMENVVLTQFNLTYCTIYSSSHARLFGNYSQLVMEFGLKRNVLFFIMQTYIPSILLVMLSWVSFWINVNAVPARVALGITTVLSMTTLMIGVYNSGPKSTSYVKAVDCYVLVCYGFIFAAMIEYACVHFYLRHLANRVAMYTYAKAEGVDDDEMMSHFGFLSKDSFECVHSPDEMKDETGTLKRNCLEANGQENKKKGERIMNGSTEKTPRRNIVGSKSFPQTCRDSSKKSNDGSEKASTMVTLPNVMKTVERTDKLFRAMVPALFMLFNILYWSIYLTMKD